MKNNEKIFVTQPALPDFNKFVENLKDIWDRKYLTNKGIYHQRFESELCNFLGVKHCSLMSNGTLALLLGLHALDLKGEIITTPYSFVATTHAIIWNGQTPVFCDIDAGTFNIDANKIERLITDKTSAILATHTYGYPCDTEKIFQIAQKYNLKVIYDAAHAFGVEKNNESILHKGDLSILSFHSTKVFNSIEGGAVVTNNEHLKRKADLLRNFGITDEVTVILPGLNAKMNELQSAYGLLQLEIVTKEIEKRKDITEYYRKYLSTIKGITVYKDIENIKHNYSYFPILIDPKIFGKSRDQVYDALRKNEIYARKYFFPLISTFPGYHHLPSASKENLPIATKVSEQVLCLPIYGELGIKNAARIQEIINKI